MMFVWWHAHRRLPSRPGVTDTVNTPLNAWSLNHTIVPPRTDGRLGPNQ
ncbi:hypothetical protein [Mycobacteroides immunogenum]|nr:hypothetical protein [Mycobacteroides immunogenum]